MNNAYTLNKNGDYYQVAWRDARGNRRRKSVGKVSIRDARIRMNELIAEHYAIPASREITNTPTLSQWIERYFHIRSSELCVASVAAARTATNYLLEFFNGDIRLSDITIESMTDWRIWLGQQPLKRGEGTLGESTVCKHCKDAKSLFKRAVREQAMASSPADHLRTTAPTKTIFERRAVTMEELETVIPELGWAEPIVMICYWAGLRRSEAIHLKHEDIISAPHLCDVFRIVPRGGVSTTKQHDRLVRCEPELKKYLGSRGSGKGCSPAEILERGSENSIGNKIRLACEKTGVEPFTLNDLRRARSTAWFSEYPEHVAAAWMGHKKTTAEKYYHTISKEHYK